MRRIIRNSLKKGLVTKKIERPVALPEEIGVVGSELKSRIYKKFGRSLHIREVDTGSCGACESEIIAATNPIYDIQRFGIDFVASPRHADCLLVTGPVSKNMALALKKTFDAAAEPKFVITLGDCALNGGIYSESGYVSGGVNNVLPVSFHIPGCPPSPLTIIKAFLSFIDKIQ